MMVEDLGCTEEAEVDFLFKESLEFVIFLSLSVDM